MLGNANRWFAISEQNLPMHPVRWLKYTRIDNSETTLIWLHWSQVEETFRIHFQAPKALVNWRLDTRKWACFSSSVLFYSCFVITLRRSLDLAISYSVCIYILGSNLEERRSIVECGTNCFFKPMLYGLVSEALHNVSVTGMAIFSIPDRISFQMELWHIFTFPIKVEWDKDKKLSHAFIYGMEGEPTIKFCLLLQILLIFNFKIILNF